MNNRSGNSLFEVLIAFAIMSMVLVALIPNQSSLLARSTDQNNTSLAYEYLLSKQAEILTNPASNTSSQTHIYWDWHINYEVSPSSTHDQIFKAHLIASSATGKEITDLSFQFAVPDAE